MRVVSGILLFAALPQCQLFAEAAATHVVHISIDGLGSVYLLAYVMNAPSQYANFMRLQNEGAYTYNARCDYFASETIPNHATIFTGRPVLQPDGFPPIHHGYDNNMPLSDETFHNYANPAVPYKASFFDVAHDHGLSTAFYAGKTRLAICHRSYNDVNGALDLIDPDDGRDKIDAAVINDGPSITAVVDPLLQNLSSAQPRRYSFIHLREPDITGHGQNWGSPAYSNMVRNVDQQLGRILATVQQNPGLSNRTCLIVTSDHGGGGGAFPNQHSRPEYLENYTIPFFLWGPGIPGGTDLYTLFANRENPGTKRTEYTTVPQPIRNGDGGNLALSLLGLPFIPGSFMQPLFIGPRLIVTRETDSTGAAMIKLTWQDSENKFLLKWTDSLDAPIQWEDVSGAVTVEGDLRTYREPYVGSIRFFTLQPH
jgi:predicted AlkP superfamily pyrophosphatase or phosphodiesterase